MIKKFFYSIFDCYKNYCERKKAILEFDRLIDSGIIKKRGYMNHGVYMNIFYIFAKTKDGDISIFFTEGIVGYELEIKMNGKYVVFNGKKSEFVFRHVCEKILNNTKLIEIC